MTRPVWSFRLVREIIGCIAMETFDFDLFVSHASEDKNRFVRPLVAALEDAHLSVWYDEAELQPGESLIQSVERGLATSRFGAIVLSPAFFAKRWPRRELDALTSRELATGESVLLPIWLDVDEAEVRRYSPLLADRFAIVAPRSSLHGHTRNQSGATGKVTARYRP